MTIDPDETVPAVWQREFTVENLIDYARASRDLSAYMRVLNAEGFKNLVVPSRGAMPFVRAATRAWMLEAKALPTSQARLAQKFDQIDSPFMRKLILPFSADPNQDCQTTGAIREYWAHVLSAIIRRDGRDPRLGFYKFQVERLAGRLWADALDRDLPRQKFIFVDTVISGRAICEILAAFEKLDLRQCHVILIADENGAKIESQYRRTIDDLVNLQRCTLIGVNRIFTEDRGPGASGVWSTVYPQVLDAARQAFPWARECYGAGTFYHLVSSAQVDVKDGIGLAAYNMPVTQMYGSISTGIFSALMAMQESDEVEKVVGDLMGQRLPELPAVIAGQRSRITEALRRQLEFQLHDMRETLSDFGPYSPLDKRTTKILGEPRVAAVHPDAEIAVSSSHLLRVTLPEAKIAALMQEVRRELAAGHDVLADDWFR